MVSGSGNDLLEGGEGDDRLEAYTGDDTLEGGQGSDIFVFQDSNQGSDIILDFEAGTDTIQFSGRTGITNYDEVKAALSQSGDDTIVEIGENSSITLHQFDVDSLSEGDFAFV